MIDEQIDLKDKHVVIAVPAYDGKVPLQWSELFFELSSLAKDYKFKVSLSYQLHGALMANNRQRSCYEFLKIKEATHLLFIDSDILFDPMDIVKLMAITSLEDTKYDIVVGPYTIKQDEPKFHLELIKDGEASKHGLWPIVAAGSGFMMIKRSVIEKMNNWYTELKYINRDTGTHMHALYIQMMDKSRLDDEQVLLGEDVSFCRRWTKIGGKIWCDPNIRLKHIGTKTYDTAFEDVIKLFDKE